MKNTDRPKVRRYILRFCLALQDQKIISTIYFFGLQRADSCSICRRTAHPALNVIVIPPEVKFKSWWFGFFFGWFYPCSIEISRYPWKKMFPTIQENGWFFGTPQATSWRDPDPLACLVFQVSKAMRHNPLAQDIIEAGSLIRFVKFLPANGIFRWKEKWETSGDLRDLRVKDLSPRTDSMNIWGVLQSQHVWASKQFGTWKIQGHLFWFVRIFFFSKSIVESSWMFHVLGK